MRTLLQTRRGPGASRCLALAVLAGVCCAWGTRVAAKEAEWIWSPAYEKELAPQGTCYFRKSFNLAVPEKGTVHISCDDSYELYVNGRHVGAGSNWKMLDSHDITKLLVQGANTISVKCTNSTGSSAGLAARVVVKQQGNTAVEHSTDATWKTTLKEFPGWQKQRFNDKQWLAARSFGALGATLPWGNEVTLAGADGRFKVTPEFNVEWVAEPKDTGSLIAMTFDEFGQLIISRENGGLSIIRDEDRDGLVETVTPYCDQLKNCQGLLSVSGKLFAVGDGPQGSALYRLSDEDQDGRIDRVEVVLKFTGEIGEHGPHAITLGPDGLLYLVVGNFSRAAQQVEPSSPYHDFYEGDLVTPRYEDAGGHAVGIKAPGGSIIRTDTSGSAVELFAGGLQNPYDLVFNEEGELFTCDSDMEWDSGMPWYRPTRLLHVSAGAEFGWRSGWAKWPNYFIDSLAPTLEMGRGSPAGMEVYSHHMFPKRYHNALFVCDWSRGRILAVRTKQHGASYKATAEVFVEGQPLNATDIAVGPDGWLYFCTGGRDTEGGVYRIVWDGKVPPEVTNRGKGLAAALNQPQPNSAWGRQQIALAKQQVGKEWAAQLTAVVRNQTAPPVQRVRALDLMQLFGPYPTSALLVELSSDRAALVRAKIAYLMGVHADDRVKERLVEMLADKELSVQRAASDALARTGGEYLPEKLIALLGSPDRYVSWAAGRALQQIETGLWEQLVLENKEPRVFLTGGVALMSTPNVQRETVEAVLNRCSALLKTYLDDYDFLSLMRLIQVALIQGQVQPEEVTRLRTQLAEEYPSRDVRMNRELVRLLVYLQEPTLAERMVEQLASDIPSLEKMQLVTHARFLTVGWTVQRKLDVLKAYEEARTIQGGHSFAGYIENVSRDFFATFDEQERQTVLTQGAKWPTSALSVLAKLPEEPSPETLKEIVNLDRQVKKVDSEAAKRLRIGICAVLGASKDPQAMAYLRELFESEPDRRVAIAIGLAQQPEGENWPLLVRSLSIVEGNAAQEVLMRLAQVDEVCEEPEALRQVILRGLLLRENGGLRACELLQKWTGQEVAGPNDPWEKAIEAWQAWFTDTYPELPEPKLPAESEESHWTYQELLSFLTGPQASQGAAARGAIIFERAQCVKCHRFNDRGDIMGPDLTNVAKRFQKKEILESILYPSHVISDQFASQTIVTVDGKSYQGLVSPTGDSTLVVMQASGDKVTIAEQKVESMVRSKISAMPDGLLNNLTLEEVADLFAFLSGQTGPARPAVTRRPAVQRIK